MPLLKLFGIPAAIGLLLILAISLNGINPWAGQPKPRWMKDAAFAVIVICFIEAIFRLLGGAR